MLTKIKERPILFKGEMVRAILEGRKTETRRVIKPQPRFGYWMGMDCRRNKSPQNHYFFSSKEASYKIQPHEGHDYILVKCPYGKPGERLWVRETWVLNYVGKPIPKKRPVEPITGEPGEIFYQADGEQEACFWDESGLKWKPSIHMPRWASRIDLEIVKVGVERLQDITEDDSRAEGCKSSPFDISDTLEVINDPKSTKETRELAKLFCGGTLTAKWDFWNLWTEINGEDSWQANPWVWVIEFRRVKP